MFFSRARNNLGTVSVTMTGLQPIDHVVREWGGGPGGCGGCVGRSGQSKPTLPQVAPQEFKPSFTPEVDVFEAVGEVQK